MAPASSRRGFTLVELVVVVLILGIIAAVALPRMSARTNTAKINSAKQSLATIRDAIEFYRADHGEYPPSSTSLIAVLKPYLKGAFPTAPWGDNTGSSAVTNGADPAVVVAGDAGWAYVASTGYFYLNDASALGW